MMIHLNYVRKFQFASSRQHLQIAMSKQSINTISSPISLSGELVFYTLHNPKEQRIYLRRLITSTISNKNTDYNKLIKNKEILAVQKNVFFFQQMHLTKYVEQQIFTHKYCEKACTFMLVNIAMEVLIRRSRPSLDVILASPFQCPNPCRCSFSWNPGFIRNNFLQC